MMRVLRIKNGKKYWVNIPTDDEAGFCDSAGSGSNPSSPPVYPPFISLNPLAITTGSGATVSFTSIAGPSGPFDWLIYGWQQDGAAISDGAKITGSLTTTLILTNVAGAEAGDYTMTATNQYGNTTSSIAALTVV